MEVTRRELLRLMASGAAAGQASLLSGQSFVPDVELTLRAAPGEAHILPGAPTPVWRFSGELIKGPPRTVRTMPDSYLGPVLRLRKGQKVRVRFFNGLSEPTIVHWHGMDMPAAMDGHPRLVIAPGREFVYDFEVTNRAGTYWYHPHPHHRTGPQVYHGLAGLLLIEDAEEDVLGLPSGDRELICVLQDRQFDARNQLVYLPGGMMQHARGFLGDRVLVNGHADTSLDVATQAYRLRIFNGSNARIYQLAWSDGTPLTVIGTDGGLLEQPVPQASLTLAPAQRADVILDLGERRIGTRIELRSLEFPSEAVDTAGMGMGMGMMSGRGRGRGVGGGMAVSSEVPPNGAPLTLLRMTVTRHEPSHFRLPARLSRFGGGWTSLPTARDRRVPLGFQHGDWLLDDRTFDMTSTTAQEVVTAHSVQVWELVNVGGMMGMQAAHPIHLHGPQFRVVSRTAGSGAAQSLRQGLLEGGWLDTVLVLPGETVRIKIPFTQHRGLYLYHCHVLEHEDMGMMRNFRVI